jgi:hypothetical protein
MADKFSVHIYCHETDPSVEINYSRNSFLKFCAAYSDLLGTFCELGNHVCLQLLISRIQE